jgi:uncharacterized membrane protein
MIIRKDCRKGLVEKKVHQVTKAFLSAMLATLLGLFGLAALVVAVSHLLFGGGGDMARWFYPTLFFAYALAYLPAAVLLIRPTHAATWLALGLWTGFVMLFPVMTTPYISTGHTLHSFLEGMLGGLFGLITQFLLLSIVGVAMVNVLRYGLGARRRAVRTEATP